MSFWGLSQTGKNAQGNLGELPIWSKGGMQDAKTRSNSAFDLAGQYNAPVANYYTGAMQNGFGTPQDIRSWGQQAMPGVDSTMQGIRDAYAGVQSPYDTTNQQNNNLNATQAYNDAAYNGAKKLTSDMYGTLIPQTAQAYSTAQSNLQRLLPGGDLLAADAARSFAPAVAATNRNLRMSGIDPTSPEASGQVQAVQAQRGRSMDDVLANNMGNYVSQGNALTLGGNQAQNQLGLGRTNDINNLNLQQASTQAGLNNQRNQIVQNMRDMGMQDAQIQQQLGQLGLNLSNQQFQTGIQGMGLNQQQQNLGAGGLGNLAGQQYNQGNINDQAARGWNQQAFGQYGGDLGVEGQNAGWGTKLLGGMIGPALNLIPGVGPALSGAFGGLGGGIMSGIGGGAMGSGSPYGMGGTPSFNGLSNWLGGLGKPSYASYNSDGSGNFGY